MFACGSNAQWQGSLNCVPVTCPATIPQLDSRFDTSACSGFNYFGAGSCQVACVPGFNSSGNGLFTCDASGNWVGSLTCRAKDCGPRVNNLAFATVVNNTCAGDTTFGGDNCIVRCQPGYIGSGEYTCSSDGVWAGPASVLCMAVECPRVIPNLDVNAGGVCNGDLRYPAARCQPFCVTPGYVAAGTPYFTCNTEGQWEGDFHCLPVDCGPTIASLDNTFATATCAGNTRYLGNDCVASCKPGYFQVSASDTYTCGANGQWQGDLECEVVDCGILRPFSAPTLDENAVVPDCDTRYGQGGCPVYCPAGFTASGTGSFQCSADGRWVGSITCTPILCPATISGLPTGAVASCSDRQFGGTYCMATCTTGYFAIGNAAYFCGSDGSWYGGCNFDCVGELLQNQKEKRKRKIMLVCLFVCLFVLFCLSVCFWGGDV